MNTNLDDNAIYIEMRGCFISFLHKNKITERLNESQVTNIPIVRKHVCDKEASRVYMFVYTSV